MKLNKCLSFALCLLMTDALAQEISIDHHKEDIRASMITYMETLNDRLSTELDSIRQNGDAALLSTSEDISVLKRLKSINATIPLEYNSQVKEYIDKYISQNYRPYMNRLMGLSQHYFQIYEQIFQEKGIPEEVKYLSLVESSLNPHLVSSAGAVGPWQFMYATAKLYNLDMNGYVDERKDAYAASYAVSSYLSEAYDQFDDWLLALASYNCGRGCVQRAIQRSGIEHPTFWELSPYLPRETRNYIPKFIAMTYAMEMADFYGISPVETELDLETKVLMLDKTIDLAQVASAINIPLDRLKKYNPSYKKNVVNGSLESPKRLLLPVTEAVNDSALYLALNTNADQRASVVKVYEVTSVKNEVKNYRAHRGESVHDVARKFGVSVQNLRAWNGLTSRSTVAGRTLIVSQPLNSKLAVNVDKAATKINRSKIVYYTVRSGDSLDRIAKKYTGVTTAQLKSDNNLKSTLIKPGMRLRISIN